MRNIILFKNDFYKKVKQNLGLDEINDNQFNSYKTEA